MPYMMRIDIASPNYDFLLEVLNDAVRKADTVEDGARIDGLLGVIKLFAEPL
jgi:hypothetical protein